MSPAATSSPGISLVLEQVHSSESDVVGHLTMMMEHHSAEHEVFHVAHDVRTWSIEHVRLIADEGRRHGVTLDSKPNAPSEVRHWKEAAAKLLGRRPETGVLLLDDMRELYLLASTSSLNWEVCAQLGQALRDEGLLGLATRCHPQTLRQVRWANTMLKIQSPQVLASL
jgi:hypothetical protein